MKKFDWLNKKTPRSVDQLRLWPGNPRLNPEENHISLSDYAEDLTFEQSDKNEFYDLVKSIADDGFIPYDPIVVWKNEENDKYYVAEGNRRLVALKLLRTPLKAPRSIRGFILQQARKIKKEQIEKIYVNIAPTFEDAEWYINQRNSASTLQRPWSRIQQQRWIAELYQKYNGNTDKITSITKLSSSDLEDTIRILKLKDLVKEPSVKSKLTEEEFEKANSYKFPITILERFFSTKEVRDKWGIDFEGINIRIRSNRTSFLNAYAELIKRIIDKDAEIKIDTRTITTNLEAILNSLPVVHFDAEDENAEEPNNTETNNEGADTRTGHEPEQDEEHEETLAEYYAKLKGNPNRPKLLLPIYTLHSDSYRLNGLFSEFKRMPFSYGNSISVSLRVFLDLAVLKYIETEGLETKLKTAYKASLREIPLKKRIEYIKTHCLNDKVKIIAARLVDESQQYSLDVLNGYIHGEDTHYISKQFLNGFWDFLFPLFNVLLDIREENV